MIILLVLGLATASIFSPEQVHLAWTEDDSKMSVTWAADSPSYGAKVQYTPVSSHTEKVNQYLYSANGVWTTFPNMDVPYILQRQLYVCKAFMTGLVHNQLYAYRVGSDTYGWTSQYSFQAKRDYTDNPIARLLIYGDLGVGDQIVPTVSRLLQETDTYDYDAVIHNGDIAYDLDSDQGERGDIFLRSIEPIASQLPYMVSQGNHESGPVLPHYINRFQMPGNVNNLYYSFNAGNAHFISYNTELVFNNLNETQNLMMEFLNNDLKSLNRTLYPWVVVFGHRPLYCSANWTSSVFLKSVPLIRNNADCLQNADYLRSIFEDLWYNNSVDLVITGHVHAYERLANVYQNFSVPCEDQTTNYCKGAKAPVYIVTGVPGQDDSYSPVSPTPLPFSIKQDDHLSYSRLTIYNTTHMLFEQVLSESGQIIDSLLLVK